MRGGLAGCAAGLATGATRRAGRQQDDHADGADRGQGGNAEAIKKVGIVALLKPEVATLWL